jgi:hypothetical protein
LKKFITFTAVLLMAAAIASASHHKKSKADDFKTLPGEGKKIVIDNGNYFVYSLNKRPAMGTTIVKVQIFDSSGKQLTGYKVYGESDMPSMRGHHASGEEIFRNNKKGDYLLPVNIVMRGDWEILIHIQKDGKSIYKGAVRFDV